MSITILFKNEWDLLNEATKQIEKSGKIKFRMVRAENNERGQLIFAGLKYKNQIYLTQEDELKLVMDILHKNLNIVTYINRKKLSLILCKPELLSDHLKSPF